MKISSVPPRPICLEEPCLSWTGQVCGHAVLFGLGTCVYDDPERFLQREQRLQHLAKYGRISCPPSIVSHFSSDNVSKDLALAPFVQSSLSIYEPSSYEFFFISQKQDCGRKFCSFKSQILKKFKNTGVVHACL